MSENTINMLRLKKGRSDYYEVTGGLKHDFVINLDGSTPLLGQMSAPVTIAFSLEKEMTATL